MDQAAIRRLLAELNSQELGAGLDLLAFYEGAGWMHGEAIAEWRRELIARQLFHALDDQCVN